jgi:poly(3-hydroxybutyrate) depolymerase
MHRTPWPPAVRAVRLGLSIVLAASALLAACGGGDDAPARSTGNQALMKALAAPSERSQAVAACCAADELDKLTLLEEVPKRFPGLFGNARVSLRAGPFLYRHDETTGNYVAVNGSEIYLMGPVVNSLDKPVKFATLEEFCSNSANAAMCGFKHRLQTTIDGLTREYTVYVPWKARGSEALRPAVYMLHGTGGTGEEFYSHSGWREKADQTGLVAVFPTALRHCLFEDDVTVNGSFEPNERRTPTKWAAGKLGDPAVMPLCTNEQLKDLTAETKAAVDHPLADDMAFFDRMTAVLKAEFKVDAGRIYVSGFSNGAQMSARLLVERSTVYAAGASAAGRLDDGFAPAPRPASYVYTVGELDDRYTTVLNNQPLPLTDVGTTPAFVNSFARPFTDALRLDETKYTYTATSIAGNAVGLYSYTVSEVSPPAGNTLFVAIIQGLTHRYPDYMPDVLWDFFRTKALP